MFDPKPVVLESSVVRLEPLAPGHAEDLLQCGRDASIWSYLPRGPFASLDDVNEWIGEANANSAAGTEVPFALVNPSDGRAIGSTRYLDIRRGDRGLEIGWTWIAPPYQRTAVNTHAKFLLLRHAFEALDALRVQLKTDGRNHRSQRAIERIGASREGVWRSHRLLPDGYIRDSVFYSIIAAEWPVVKERLHALMAARGACVRDAGTKNDD